jgi:hypothetical protein
MKPARNLSLALFISLLAVFSHALDLSKAPATDWIQLFNKKDLDGWVKKVSGTPAGEDPYTTWYVKDSLLWVDYTKYTGDFKDRFGHLAYQKQKFSYYLMRAVYQFWGTQATGGPAWAKENNGLMYHSQSMESMGLSQSFPDCIEFQLLGEKNTQNTDGTTANVCGVGATFIIDGVRGDYWCRKSKPHNIIGQPWVTVEGLVLGDSISRHIVEKDTVLTYTAILAKKDGKPLKDGYIAIQGETAPIKFKSIEVLDLEGCMDPKAGNYRSYFVKSNPSRCTSVVTTVKASLAEALHFQSLSGGLKLTLPPGNGGACQITITDLHGGVRFSQNAESGTELQISTVKFSPGIYFLRLGKEKADQVLKFSVPYSIIGTSP